jgi:hypothetical protein
LDFLPLWSALPTSTALLPLRTYILLCISRLRRESRAPSVEFLGALEIAANGEVELSDGP